MSLDQPNGLPLIVDVTPESERARQMPKTEILRQVVAIGFTGQCVQLVLAGIMPDLHRIS